MEIVIRVTASRVTTVQRAAMEIFLPHGGFAGYGLLGAEFVPDHSQYLTIQVATGATSVRQVNWALAALVDDVRVGLPDEYADAVLKGAGGQELLSGGVLRFAWAAHGMVGSSPMIFLRLATAVVRLISQNATLLSDEELAALLQL